MPGASGTATRCSRVSIHRSSIPRAGTRSSDSCRTGPRRAGARPRRSAARSSAASSSTRPATASRRRIRRRRREPGCATTSRTGWWHEAARRIPAHGGCRQTSSRRGSPHSSARCSRSRASPHRSCQMRTSETIARSSSLLAAVLADASAADLLALVGRIDIAPGTLVLKLDAAAIAMRLGIGAACHRCRPAHLQPSVPAAQAWRRDEARARRCPDRSGRDPDPQHRQGADVV